MDPNDDHLVAAAKAGAPADGSSGDRAELVAGGNKSSDSYFHHQVVVVLVHIIITQK